MNEQAATQDISFSIMRDLPPNFRLARGTHSTFEEGACALEAVAYLAGESHSARPQCTSSVLAVFCFRLNDQWKDDERQALFRLLPRLIGTRGDLTRHARQAHAIVDGICRDLLPMIFDARGWDDLTSKLRALPMIVDCETARSAGTTLNEVRKEVAGRRKASPPTAASYNEFADAYVDAALSATYDAAIAWTISAVDYAHDAADIYASDTTLLTGLADTYAPDPTFASLAYDAAAACAAYAACTAAYVFRHKVVEKTLDIFGRAIEA